MILDIAGSSFTFLPDKIIIVITFNSMFLILRYLHFNDINELHPDTFSHLPSLERL